jgi:regulator of sigma E protease
MSIVIMVGQLLLGLSILVILHELGHFLAARAFGIKVEKFYLFFDAWGFSLFKFNYKGVEYGIGWLPLGGYVKIAGMIDESMDTEQLAGPPQPWEFRSKPAWQRLIVMLGGITVNIIVGIFIFWILTIKYGETYIPNSEIKYGIVPGKIGKRIGLETGDRITAVNGQPVVRYEDLTGPKVLFGNTDLTVVRGNHILHVKVPGNILNYLSDESSIDQFISKLPRVKFAIDSVVPNSSAKKIGLQHGDSIIAANGHTITYFDEFKDQVQQSAGKPFPLTIKRSGTLIQRTAQADKNGAIGFFGKFDLPKEKTLNYSFFGALPVGATRAWANFTDDAKVLGKITKGEVKANKALGGPVAIANMFGSHIDWVRFWGLVGVLSIMLALTNLLPIPALDGGHALFLIIEMIKGKPLSDKFLERAQIVGFVILITLMVFVFGNDIMKQVMKK